MTMLRASCGSGHERNQIRVGWGESLEVAAKQHLLCCGLFTVLVQQHDALFSKTKAAFNAIELETGEPAQLDLTIGFQRRSHEILGNRGKWPSTGWLGLTMAVAVARLIDANVSVFGYGACRWCLALDT